MMEGDDVPPEVQEQMQQMQQMIQELQAENDNLKSERDIKMMKIEADKEESAAKMELAERNAFNEQRLKREEAAAERNLAEDEQAHDEEMDRRELQIKAWKAKEEMKIRRAQARNGAGK